MSISSCSISFRVRYSETDQMGGIYNSRVLEWFEMGRTELFREQGLPYTEVENRGVFLPLVEAHIEFEGRARYDDLLHMSVRSRLMGKARIRCENVIVHAENGKPVAKGYTEHACVDRKGKPIRPPKWLIAVIESPPKENSWED